MTASISEATALGRPTNPAPKASARVHQYLEEHLEVYRELSELPVKGWENEQADTYCKQQRQRADYADERRKGTFFHLMRSIGAEMDEATSALTITQPPGNRFRVPSILDLCMAPGGFSASALYRNPSARLCGISLPPSKGGHDILIRNWDSNPRIQVYFCDITMLATEMGTDLSIIPDNHPDAGTFSSDRPFQNQEFDLVFCDGQLVLALGHLCDGGTLVVLLHKADAWPSVSLMHTIASFADIHLFKPRRGHCICSSFYLVARGVRPDCDAALEAVKIWKAAATFGAVGECGAERPSSTSEEEEEEEEEEDKVTALLREFGPRVVELGRPVFAVQAEALRKAPFIRKNKTGNSVTSQSGPG